MCLSGRFSRLRLNFQKTLGLGLPSGAARENRSFLKAKTARSERDRMREREGKACPRMEVEQQRFFYLSRNAATGRRDEGSIPCRTLVDGHGRKGKPHTSGDLSPRAIPPGWRPCHKQLGVGASPRNAPKFTGIPKRMQAKMRLQPVTICGKAHHPTRKVYLWCFKSIPHKRDVLSSYYGWVAMKNAAFEQTRRLLPRMPSVGHNCPSGWTGRILVRRWRLDRNRR